VQVGWARDRATWRAKLEVLALDQERADAAAAIAADALLTASNSASPAVAAYRMSVQNQPESCP
jgi:hypothetical protein